MNTDIMTEADLLAGLIKHDKGVYKQGSHQPGDKEFCMLEFDSIMRGEEFSDTPGNLPDLRSLNDAYGDNDQARTGALIPVHVALWTWRTWTDARKFQWTTNVSVKLVNKIIAELPNLPENVRKQCREADNTRAAEAAAWAARAAARAVEAAARAVEATEAAARAARAAGAAARAAWAARAAGAARAAWAAEAAAWAAWAAGAAAGAAGAAALKVLNLFCKIMVEAAEETKHL